MFEAALIFNPVSEAGSWRMCISQWVYNNDVVHKDVSPG